MPLLTDSASMAMNFNMDLLLKDQHHRLDPVLPKQIALDDVERMPELIEIGDKADLRRTFEFLETHFSRYKD
jgi:hypothetical protein